MRDDIKFNAGFQFALTLVNQMITDGKKLKDIEREIQALFDKINENYSKCLN